MFGGCAYGGAQEFCAGECSHAPLDHLLSSLRFCYWDVLEGWKAINCQRFVTCPIMPCQALPLLLLHLYYRMLFGCLPGT